MAAEWHCLLTFEKQAALIMSLVVQRTCQGLCVCVCGGGRVWKEVCGHQCACLSVYQYACFSSSLSACLCLSVCLSACLFTCLPVHSLSLLAYSMSAPNQIEAMRMCTCCRGVCARACVCAGRFPVIANAMCPLFPSGWLIHLHTGSRHISKPLKTSFELMTSHSLSGPPLIHLPSI